MVTHLGLNILLWSLCHQWAVSSEDSDFECSKGDSVPSVLSERPSTLFDPYNYVSKAETLHSYHHY